MTMRTVAARAAITIATCLFAVSPPAAATDVVGQTSANLAWTAASGSVAGYGIYISRNGGAYPATPNATSAAPGTTVSGAYGDTLLVKVAAYDASGVYGPFSPESDPIHFVQAQPAVIGLGATSLVAAAVAGQSPASQTFTVANTGAGTLSYSISENQSWLSVSPATGTSTGELDTVTVSYATGGLSAGTYGATITVSGGAGVASQSIAVSLTISAAPAPAMTLSASALSASTQQGQSPADQSFTIRNSGTGGTLAYSVSDNASWLAVSPATGTSTGETDTLVVSFAATGLATGTYTASITASATGVASQVVSVSLSVVAAPTPAMTLSASALGVSVSQGNDAASRSFTIRNSGTGGTLSYAFSESASWLAVSPASGTSTGETDTITVSFTTASLTAGTYNATITASATGVASQSVAVTVTVTSGNPVIEVSPTSLTATGVQGINAPSVTFTIRNAGGGTLNWAVSDFQSWMSQTPASGSSTGEADTVTVVFDSATRSAGTYSSSISVTAGLAATVTIPVTLTINQPAPAVIETSVASLSPTATAGSNAASQTFTVRNAGGGALNWSASESASWMSLSPATGTSTGEADTVSVSYATSGLAAGTYTAPITMSAPGVANVTVNVTLTVGGAPALAVSTTSLTASITAGQNAAAQSFTVRNSGGGSLAWSVSDNVSWLSLSPATGTSTGEADSVSVSFAASGLAAGTYNGTITVAGTGVASRTVAVTLYVNAAPPPPPPSTPAIGLSTSTLGLKAKAGKAMSGQVFSVRNTGTGALNYSVSDDASWMTVSPASGASTGESDTITISFPAGGLSVGTYTGTVTVSATGIASKTVGVTLTVGASGERFDLDGDGGPELVWSRPISGDVEVWDLAASGVTGSVVAPLATAGWKVVAVNDFDGDGRHDLLWRTTTPGQYSLWRMNGATRLSTATLQAPSGYEALAAGDFDADGKSDMLWVNAAGDAVRLTLLAGGTNASTAVSNEWAFASGWLPVGTADFNGDGHDDILWRSGGGTMAIWFMTGATYGYAGVITTLSTDWYIEGASDFNGDGTADLLLHQLSAGDLVVWYLNGASLVSGVYLAQGMDRRLEVAALGDFDRDGRSDVVMRHKQTGANTLWRTAGASVVTVPLTTRADPEWTVVNPWSLAWPKPADPSTPGDLDGDHTTEALWSNAGTGAAEAWQIAAGGGVSTLALPSATPGWTVEAVDDFDGDAKSDVLWKTPGSSTYTLWRMNGGTRLSTATLQAPSGFRVEAVGDFDGDQKADVLWRDDVASLVRMTLLKGGTNVATAPSATWSAPASWAVLGAGDFNGDKKDDLLWREAGGAIAVWILSGTTLAAGVSVGAVGPSWVIAGTSDIDGDGSDDLVLRETGSGQNVVWLLRYGGLAGGFYLPTWAGASNQPMAVRDYDGDGRGDILWRNTSTGAVTLWTELTTQARSVTLPPRTDPSWKLNSGW
jgi:uncharacterized membrane protein